MLATKQMLRQSVIVDMTPSDIALSKTLGKARCDAKPAHIREHDSGYHPDHPEREYPHQIGVHGERAYGKFVGLNIDTSLKTGGDETDFDGVEVKTRTKRGKPRLVVKVHEYDRKKPRKYVLAVLDEGDWSKVELKGEISREDFDQHKQLDNFGKSDVFVVENVWLSSVTRGQ